MFPYMIGTVVIAGIVGYLSERSGFTRNVSSNRSSSVSAVPLFFTS